MTEAKMYQSENLRISIFSVLALFGVFISSPSSNAQENNVFYCGKQNGEPATMMRVGTQSIFIIIWRNNDFEFTPQERCEVVSQRFQDEYEEGNNFITLGTKNGYNIICSTNKPDGGCIKELMALPANYDPNKSLETLRQVLDNDLSSFFIN